MSRILGVDIGSRVLACSALEVEKSGIRFQGSISIEPKKHWPIERRFEYIDRKLAEECRWYDPNIMACEEPWKIVGRKDVFAALWRTVGHCEAMANRFGIAFRLVPVADWRRTSGIKGKNRAALKAAAIQAAKVLLHQTLPEDEAEAALVARHAALTMK